MEKTSELIWQDVQHQDLLKLVHSLKKRKTAEILSELRQYITLHFRLEEAYMDELGFPGAEEHKNAHRNFENNLQKLISKQVIFDDQFKDELATFLENWLLDHVKGIDKLLEQFVLDNQRKC